MRDYEHGIRGWSDDDITLLKSLWEAGNSGGIIGQQMGRTRNSIIGKAHRLGLAGRPPTIAKPGYNPNPKRERMVARQRFEISIGFALTRKAVDDNLYKPVGSGGATIIDAVGCRYPLDTKDKQGMAMFCDEPQADGMSYCRIHARKCYTIMKQTGRQFVFRYIGR